MPATEAAICSIQKPDAASVVLWVTEWAAARVSAFEYRGGFPVDLADSLAVAFDDGSVATIAGTGSIHEHPFRVEEYRFFGSNGRALLNTASGTLDVALAGARPNTASGPARIGPLVAHLGCPCRHGAGSPGGCGTW